jgi:hypothetical protein
MIAISTIIIYDGAIGIVVTLVCWVTATVHHSTITKEDVPWECFLTLCDKTRATASPLIYLRRLVLWYWKLARMVLVPVIPRHTQL